MANLMLTISLKAHWQVRAHYVEWMLAAYQAAPEWDLGVQRGGGFRLLSGAAPGKAAASKPGGQRGHL